MTPEDVRVARGGIEGYGHHVDRLGSGISIYMRLSGQAPFDEVADAGDHFDGPEWVDVAEDHGT